MIQIQPFGIDKRLGIAYNDAMSRAKSNEWVTLMDYDANFITPQSILHVHNYTQMFPDTGIFTCYTNRIHPLNKWQLYNDKLSEDTDIKNHIPIARSLEKNLYQVTELTGVISGFCMVVKRETWEQVKFAEHLLCLGVDNDFSRRVLALGKKILRMDGIYAFHNYRIENGHTNKSHLI